MSSPSCPLLLAVVFLMAPNCDCAVRYVNLNNSTPISPYTSWTTAATNIQDAVSAAIQGDEVVVTNGVYASGGIPHHVGLARVVVTNAITLRSVNGPGVTIIQGSRLPDIPTRCVYLAEGATLAGFTLTNGGTPYTAQDRMAELITGGGVYCASRNALVLNCVLVGNTASAAGGAYRGTLVGCSIVGNSTQRSVGSGAYQSLLNNCTITGNSGSSGVYQCALNNCIVYYNSEGNHSLSSFNYSCTTPLPTTGDGNIDEEPQLASASHLSANSPCRGAGNGGYATGLDIDGEEWAEPPSMGADEHHLGAITGPLSVAIGAIWTNVAVGFVTGFTAVVDGRTSASRWDFDDGTLVSNRLNTVHSWSTAGDYKLTLTSFNESHPDGVSTIRTIRVTNPVLHVAPESSNPVAPYSSWATAATNIQDAIDANNVPGAIILVTNGVYATGDRMVYGPRGGLAHRVAVTMPLTLRSVNGPAVTIIEGARVSEVGPVRCVYLTNAAVISGFTITNGSTRELDDRDPAVETFKTSGGGVWCNSVSAVVTNCVLVGNSTWDDTGSGGGVYGGTLNNCTLVNNSRAASGGGAAGSILNNCILSGNSAERGAGADSSILNNCTLTGNHDASAASDSTLNNCSLTGNFEGAANSSTLNNCTVTGNTRGVDSCTLNNCIVYFNGDGVDRVDNYSEDCILRHCCTTPLPTTGFGNITNAPMLLNVPNEALRLQSVSPCINAGFNAYAPAGFDLNGQPRIVAGVVDIGAYEFQTPTSILSYAWMQRYGLSVDGSVDQADEDGDRSTNWQEWRASTDPTDASSVLRLLKPKRSTDEVVVTWQSVSGLYYFLERSTNLVSEPAFRSWRSHVVGQPEATTVTDDEGFTSGTVLYRVGVQEQNSE